MKTLEPSLTYFGPFTQKFRIQAHQLIAWGYQDALHEIRTCNGEETSITGFIAEAIDDRFCVLDCPRWCNHYSVHDDPPVKKEGRSGKGRPRTDIILRANFSGRPAYVFEAKRLQKNRYEVGRYANEEGMGCFTSGLYASRYDEAAMIGYVQSGSLLYWQDKLKRKIEKDKSKLRLRTSQRDAKVIDTFPLEWISEHERDSIGRPITIYHILLDCCS
ncbi:MAG: hypothetical protein U0401_09185 [Anaerolineae bacterium]